MAFPAHSGPWLHIQFRNRFSQTVGLLGRVISSSQGLYLNIGQNKQIKRIHIPNIHALMGFELTIRASERAKKIHALGSAATLTGLTLKLVKNF
jgi:hypothetical protein